jgi:hypothetical protein
MRSTLKRFSGCASPVGVGGITPVVAVVPVALAGVVGRAEHGEVGQIEREIRAGLAAVDVVDVEVLIWQELVLVPPAQLATAVVRPKRVVAHPAPFRGLQELRRGDGL